MNTLESKSGSIPNDAKKVFRKLGTCSRTFAYLLNRNFDQNKESEEIAADPLSGGIMRKGYQCGMLWGSSLAIGAQSFRLYPNKENAISVAVSATKKVVQSFFNNVNTIECRTFTDCDFLSPFSFAKFLLTGRFLNCFALAEQWAPDAIITANEALNDEGIPVPHNCLSCASEVVKKMGGTDEEIIMVSGFAGGLGLSGSGCGALRAAIWKKSLDWSKEHPGKSAYSIPGADKTMKDFVKATNSEFVCHKLCNHRFENIEEHTKFVQNGGCEALINLLAKS